MRFRAHSTGRVDVRSDDRLVLNHAELHGAEFSGRKLVQLSVAESRLVDCRFDGMRVENASLGAGRKMSHYIGCVFDGARLKFDAGGYARFERCSFRQTDLRDWFCFAVELVDCTFSGRLRKAVFNGVVPPEDRAAAGRNRNEFRGNDFSGMDLVDVGFRTGIDLTLQRLPSGPPYLYLPDAVAAVRRAREGVAECKDPAVRQKAMALIGALEDELSEGQRQLFLRKDAYARLPEDAVDAVFRLLAA
jgi:hypothetical protein